MKKRSIGHIPGVVPGTIFHRRRHVFDALLHGDLMRGISTLVDEAHGDKVADAIVLNGGYEDDEDHWDWIRYTGAGGQDETAKKQVASQDWAREENAALQLSYEREYPIRIIRGYNGDKRFSLKDNYRYDGLYRITETRTAVSKTKTSDGSAIYICQFDLHRLPDSFQELSDAAQKAATLFDFDLEGNFPKTQATIVQRIVRDSAMIRRVKAVHNHECQVCGIYLVGADGKRYSEGAHIQPLGKSHRGPDVEQNILCLCPNCHVRLDRGSFFIQNDWTIVDRAVDPYEGVVLPQLRRQKAHPVRPEYVTYHREWWDKKLTSMKSDS